MITVKALHTISGQVAVLPKRIVDHPILGKYLVEVDETAKPYASELFKATTPEEFAQSPRRNRKKSDEENTVNETDQVLIADSVDISIDEDN